MAKSWREKFLNPKEPRIEIAEKAFWGLEPGDRMLISTPAEIDGYLRGLAHGARVDLSRLRADLAARHGAKTTCPLTTGIFLRIVSEVAMLDLAEGREPAPFWRVVDPKSPLAKKLTGGPERVRELLAEFN